MPELAPPVPLASLAGGHEALQAATSRACLVGSVRQQRLQAFLERLGPPGQWRVDPHTAELEMRGHTFRAESIGSWDGANWLQARSNPFLDLSEQVTTVSRRAADLGIPALSEPFVHTGDPATPHRMGMVAAGHGLCEAYYVCQFSGAEVVYAILDDLQPEWPVLYELQRALQIELQSPLLAEVVPALRHAAECFGLALQETEGGLRLRDGDETLDVDLRDGQVTGFRASVAL